MGFFKKLFSGLPGDPASIARVMRDSYLKIKERNPDMNENEILSKVLVSRYFDYDRDKLARLLYEYPNIRLLTFAVIANEFGDEKTAKYIKNVINDINNNFGSVGLVSVDTRQFFHLFDPLGEADYVSLPGIGICGIKLGRTRQEFMQKNSEATKEKLRLSSKSENLCSYGRVKICNILMDIVFCFTDNQLYEVSFNFLQPFYPIKEKMIRWYGNAHREEEESFPVTNTITYWEKENSIIRLDYNETKLGGISFTIKAN